MEAAKRKGNNPLGKNQYANIRAKNPISVRLLREQDTKLREIAHLNNKTLTQILDEAVNSYLVGIEG